MEEVGQEEEAGVVVVVVVFLVHAFSLPSPFLLYCAEKEIWKGLNLITSLSLSSQGIIK